MKHLQMVSTIALAALITQAEVGCGASPSEMPPDGKCGSGASKCVCDDQKECTADSYDESSAACVYAPLPPGAPCADTSQVCDGKQSCAPSGKALWTKRLGGSGFEQLRGLAIGSDGQIAITGWSDGPLDLGGGTLAAKGSADIYVAVFDKDGNHTWSKRFGDTTPLKYQFGEKVVFDKAGNLLLTGYFAGTLDFGGGPLVSVGSGDFFFAKFDPKGGLLWSKHFAGNSVEHRFALAIDDQENIFFSGAFAAALDFGLGPLPTTANAEVFLAKFDKDGKVLWNKSFGSVQDQDGYGLALDRQGNAVISGYFENQIDFGSGVMSSAGMFIADAFLAKFDGTGRNLWSKHFGGTSGPAVAYGVAIDGADNIAVTGQIASPVDLGKGPLGTLSTDAFIAKFDAQGELLFAKAFGDDYEQLGRDVTFDRFGNILFTGRHSGTIDLGGGPLTATSNGYNFFAAKFAPDGTHKWSRTYGGDKSFQIDQRLRASGPGYLVIAGHFDHTIDLGLGQLTSQSNDDLFLAQLIP